MTKMLVQVDRIKDGETHQLDFSGEGKAMELEFPDMIYLKPVAVCLKATRQGDVLQCAGSVATQVKRICGRTLDETIEDIRESFEWFYDIKNVHQIDVTDNVRELLIEQHPMVYRKPDSKFSDYVEKDSPAEQKNRQSPFDALKQWKDKRSN